MRKDDIIVYNYDDTGRSVTRGIEDSATQETIASVNAKILATQDRIRKELQITPPSEYYVNRNLNRFRLRYPDLEQERSTGYVFFTKPDLNLLNATGDVLPETSVLVSLRDILQSRDIEIARCLKLGFEEPYIAPITNYAENLEVQDVQMKTRQTAESSGNWKVEYGFRTNDTKNAGQFSISYTDDVNLTIYKLHKIWVEYMDAVANGSYAPMRTYIVKRILDYACSAFYVLVGEDGETIRYYAKYTGVFPTVIPDGAYSWQQGDEGKRRNFQIQYQYSFFDSMNPLIIKDFNTALDNFSGPREYQPTYNPASGLTGPTWCKGVKIIKKTDEKTGKLDYLLKFLK